MTTIYIVTNGSYSDYHIEAVFSTKAAAEAWLAEAQESSGFSADLPQIEEWPLDERAGEILRTAWRCGIRLDSGEFYGEEPLRALGKPQERTATVEEYPPQLPAFGGVCLVISYVSAEHARKLAVEYRQKWLRDRGET
jgi:hypothetical protein